MLRRSGRGGETRTREGAAGARGMTRADKMRTIEGRTTPRRPRARAPMLTRVATRGARASASGASRRHGRGVSQAPRNERRRTTSPCASRENGGRHDFPDLVPHALDRPRSSIYAPVLGAPLASVLAPGKMNTPPERTGRRDADHGASARAMTHAAQMRWINAPRAQAPPLTRVSPTRRLAASVNTDQVFLREEMSPLDA